MTQLIQTIVLGLLLGGVYALLASGLTLIFGVMEDQRRQGALIILAAFITGEGTSRAEPIRACSGDTRRVLIGYGIS